MKKGAYTSLVAVSNGVFRLNKVTPNVFTKTLENISRMMVQTFGQRCMLGPVSEPDFEYLTKSESDIIIRRIQKCIRQLRRKDLDCISGKITLNGINSELFLMPTKAKQQGSSDKQTEYLIRLFISDTDGNAVAFIATMDLSAEDVNKSLQIPKNTVAVFSDKFIVKNSIMHSVLASFNDTDTESDILLSLIATTIQSIVDAGTNRFEIPFYNKTELQIYDWMSQMHDVKYVSSVTFCSSSTEEGANGETASLYPPEEIIPSIRPNDGRLIPIVRFSDKEWKFVNKWISNKNIKENHLNLHSVFANLRYGNSLKFPVKHPETEEEIILDVSLIFSDDDMINIVITEKISDSCTYWCNFRLKNASDFASVNDNIRNIEQGFYVLKPSDFEREKFFNSYIRKENAFNVISFLIDVINAFIVIQNRPERSKIIKCSVSGDAKPDGKKSSADKPAAVKPVNDSTSDKEEKEYVLWRVLAPAKEAKDYIREATGKHFSRADAIYTLEEWDRCGYFRTLKSGKVVWVEPTHCKRHLPISDEKEIQLKL